MGRPSPTSACCRSTAIAFRTNSRAASANASPSRALILKPSILLLDEPTSALDVSVQAEILNLISRLRKTYQLTSILVSHDLGVVAHLCSRIAIMRTGQLVELLDVADLRRGQAKEPYTRELLAASRGFTRA